MMWIYALLLSLLLLTAACSSLPETSLTGTVREIRIGEHVSPKDILAFTGDEVRWVNLRGEAVRLGFLGSKPFKEVACERGFSDFGLMQDFVTIPPKQSASLCFANPGDIHYNVWLDTDDLHRAMSTTATIRVRGA